MARVEIITRALNRLEYTVLCIRSIADKSGYSDYKHIIINQNSSDGTKEWLDSLLKEGYYKLKVRHNLENSGDAGGMREGFEMVNSDCEYVMQFDNDCMVIDNNFLFELIKIMDMDKTIGILMMKRLKVKNIIRTIDEFEICGHKVGRIDKATCCCIMRRELVEKLNIWFDKEKIGWIQNLSWHLRNQGYKILKCLDLRVEHIDGSEKQSLKYPLYFSGKKSNAVTSNYTDINYL